MILRFEKLWQINSTCCHGLVSGTLISCYHGFDSSCCRVLNGFCFSCCPAGSGYGIVTWMESDVPCDLHENLIWTWQQEILNFKFSGQKYIA